MGECRWSVRVVTGLCRSYSMHMDEHRVHTWHTGTARPVYFIAYAHINSSSCIQQGTELPQTHCMFFVELISCAQWTRIVPTQVSTLSKLQEGQGRHAPENLDRARGTRRKDRGSPHENQELSSTSPDIQFMHYVFHSSRKDHPHPKQQSHKSHTAFVGSQLGWVMDLSFVAQSKHCGGVRRTSLSCHFSLWVSSGIFMCRVVSQSCPSAKSQQKMNSLKWKTEFCREPGL